MSKRVKTRFINTMRNVPSNKKKHHLLVKREADL